MKSAMAAKRSSVAYCGRRESCEPARMMGLASVDGGFGYAPDSDSSEAGGVRSEGDFSSASTVSRELKTSYWTVLSSAANCNRERAASEKAATEVSKPSSFSASASAAASLPETVWSSVSASKLEKISEPLRPAVLLRMRAWERVFGGEGEEERRRVTSRLCCS